MLYYPAGASCWEPWVKGLTLINWVSKRLHVGSPEAVEWWSDTQVMGGDPWSTGTCVTGASKTRRRSTT